MPIKMAGRPLRSLFNLFAIRNISFILPLMLAMYVTPPPKCAFDGIYPTSKNRTLQNGNLLVFEFYGISQNIVPGLNKKSAVYLRDGEKKIPLQVTEILKGEKDLTQVIFKPTGELVAGRSYEFMIDDLTRMSSPGEYNPKTSKREPFRFNVIAGNDTQIPVITGVPVELKKTMVHYGCGPAKWVHFKLPASDNNEILVRTTVINSQTGVTTEFLLPLEDGTVKIGHGMCSGAFKFQDQVRYEVIFSAMDRANNHSTATNRVSFTGPVHDTVEE